MKIFRIKFGINLFISQKYFDNCENKKNEENLTLKKMKLGKNLRFHIEICIFKIPYHAYVYEHVNIKIFINWIKIRKIVKHRSILMLELYKFVVHIESEF